MERLGHQFAERIGVRLFADSDERAETVHWNWPFLFNSVAALDMLLFSSLKQVGPGGHTNSHVHPHFCALGISGKCPLSGLRTHSVGTARTLIEASLLLASLEGGLRVRRNCVGFSSIYGDEPLPTERELTLGLPSLIEFVHAFTRNVKRDIGR